MTRAQDAEDIVVIAGGSGFENAGDEVLLRRTHELCLTLVPRTSLVVSANNPRVAASTLSGLPYTLVSSLRAAFFHNDAHYHACDDVFRARWSAIDSALRGPAVSGMIAALRTAAELDFVDVLAAEKFLQTLGRSRRLVVHGGGILTSATRSRLWEMALLCRLSSRLGVPFALKGHQIGPFFNDEDVGLAREMFDQAAFISTRDRGESWFSAVATGTVNSVYEDVDDAFFEVVEDGESLRVRDTFGLNQRGYIAACFRENAGVGISGALESLFALALGHAHDLTGLPVALVPMGPFDVASVSRIHAQLAGKSKVVTPLNWVRDAPAIVRNARFVVSVPHHPLIFALQTCTPVLSLVEGRYYSAKNRGSMRFFGLEHMVISVDTPDALARAREAVEFLAAHEESLRRYISDKVSEIALLGRRSRESFARFLAA